MVAGNGPIRQLIPVDVRQSMANGGGPACLRLRVVCDPAQVDPRFLLTEAKIDRISAIVAREWPASLHPAELAHAKLWHDITAARAKLLDALDLGELVS